MSSVSSIDLQAVHDAILAGLRAKFSTAQLPTLQAYGRPGPRITAPALFLELEDVEPDDPVDTGTEQTNVVLHFTANVVVSSVGQGTAQMAVRILALAVAAAIRGQRWGQPLGPAKFLGAEPGEFVEDKNAAYQVYRVKFTHEATIGGGIPDTFTIPTQVFLGISPLVGTPHEGDYTLEIPTS